MDEKEELRTEATVCQEGAAIKQKKAESPETQENKGIGPVKDIQGRYYNKMKFGKKRNK